MSSSLLSDSTVAFIQREVAIDMASCSSDLRPSGCRGFAPRLTPDRARLTLYVRQQEADQLLQDVQIQDVVAVVFCLPETEAAIQIKGRQVRVAPVTPDEADQVMRYCQTFVDGIVKLGYDRQFGETYMHVDPTRLMAVSFTPEQVFEQTPGPRAGRAMHGGHA